MEWKTQVAEFVTQCFQTFPQYGDGASGLETKIKTFNIGLEDYTLDELSFAFRQWLKEQKKMPLPADIVSLAKSHRAHVAAVSTPHIPATPREKPPVNAVPWSYLSWREIEAQGFIPQIEQHLIELTRLRGKERAAEYLHFLKTGPQNSSTGMPKDAA